MLTVDLSFYTERYGGTRIPAEAWPDFSRDAAAYVDTITFGRITDDLSDDTLERCRMAICAVAEQDFQQSQGGEVASASNDGYSESYVTSGQTPAQRRRAAASDWLYPTGLLYRGVNC